MPAPRGRRRTSPGAARAAAAAAGSRTRRAHRRRARDTGPAGRPHAATRRARARRGEGVRRLRGRGVRVVGGSWPVAAPSVGVGLPGRRGRPRRPLDETRAWLGVQPRPGGRAGQPQADQQGGQADRDGGDQQHARLRGEQLVDQVPGAHLPSSLRRGKVEARSLASSAILATSRLRPVEPSVPRPVPDRGGTRVSLSSSAIPRPGRAVLADLLPGERARDLALVVAYAGFTGLAAQVVVPLPFTPVPVTGQTFAVLLGAAALGWQRGFLGMGLYLAAGLAGVPWFSQWSGGTDTLSPPAAWTARRRGWC